MFEQSMCHTASPTHCLSPVADHSTRPISLRHGAPPCCHPSTTHPAGGGALSQGPDGARRSAGPRASGHPHLRAEFGDSSGGQRLRHRGDAGLCCCLGRFCLNKWFNSDALLKGTNLTGLGKSVVKIKRIMFSYIICVFFQ